MLSSLTSLLVSYLVGNGTKGTVSNRQQITAISFIHSFSARKMVRQLREVLDRHSNDIDSFNEFVDSDPSNLINSATLSSSSSSSKLHRRMGPISQFSSAFLGIDMEDDVAWDDQDFDPEKPKKRQNFGSSRMGRRTFQEFLRVIEEEKNLLDLKRVRNDVITQIRKKKALIRKCCCHIIGMSYLRVVSFGISGSRPGRSH